MRKYLNNKGSAMVLVLSTLIILIAVSSVVVMLGAAGINMSRKYSDWSSEYYWLDYAVQKRLAEIDQDVLIEAENIARYYLDGNYFRVDPEASSFPSSSPEANIIHLTFHGTRLHELIYGGWDAIYQANQPPEPEDGEEPSEPVDYAAYEEDYNEAMKDFIPKVFEVVYYAYIDDKIGDEFVEGDPDDRGITTLAESDSDWFPNVNEISDFDGLYDAVTDLSPQIAITAKEPSGNNPKQVKARITVVSPDFETTEQTKYFAVQANPLYTNAISVRGSVTFQGDSTIAGDVVASTRTEEGGLQWEQPGKDPENNEFGISAAADYAQVKIYGNVASAGNVHISDDNSTIEVLRYEDYPANPDFASALKFKRDKLYSPGNEFFYDIKSVNERIDVSFFEAEAYAEDEYDAGFGNIPYIYKDVKGGNVYCHNLSIGKNVSGGEIKVGGNVWTEDDIQNDGQNDTLIKVSGNYIGMTSTGNEGNPNNSSSIINNARLYDNARIEIEGNCVIPGTVFFKLDESDGGGYYQTAESATALGGEFFETYIEDSRSGLSLPSAEYTINGITYPLYRKGDITPEDWVHIFADFIKSKILDSKIYISPESWYSLGVIIGSENSYYAETDPNNNSLAYNDVKSEILPLTYTMKTKNYGTDGYSFDDLYDPTVALPDRFNGFYYYPGNETKNVNTLSSGIIFAGGDLTLTGPGTFTGSVICAGNLTIESGVNIIYDEAIIRETLGLTPEYDLDKTEDEDGHTIYSGSSVARRFFSPVGYSSGATLGIEKISMSSTSAVRRDTAKRYVINSWRESPVS